jgi:hypothetical protein
MLVKDHTAFLKKLQKYAPEAAQENFLTATTISSQEVRTSGPADQRKQAARREERRRERAENKGKPNLTDDQKSTDPVEQALRKGKGPIQQVAATSEITETSDLQVDVMQLHREMAEQCLADTQQLLSEKSEQEFDACFIGLQIARHASMKAKLTVCERHATGELKDLLSQARETTSEHLEHAQKLMKDLAPQATAAATKD